MSGLDAVVIGFGVTVEIFFQRKKATNIIAFGIKRNGGKSPGNSTIAFNKRMNGYQHILTDG